MYYVYELANSIDGAVFYVGKGKGRRMFAHERAALNGEASRKGHFIRQIRRNGGMVIARAVEHFESEADAYDAERELIAAHGLSNLVNIQGGGSLSPEAVAARAKRLAQAVERRRSRELQRLLDSREFSCAMDLADRSIANDPEACVWLTPKHKISFAFIRDWGARIKSEAEALSFKYSALGLN